MAEPLLTDEQVAAIIAAPQSATDDAGSVVMNSVRDVVSAMIALREDNRKSTKLNVGKVLASGKMIGVPTGY